MVGLEEKFQNKGSQMAGKRYLEIKVCKYSHRIENRQKGNSADFRTA